MSHSSNQHRVEFQAIYFMIKVGRLIDSPPWRGSELFTWAPSQEAFNSALCFSLPQKAAWAGSIQPVRISPCSTSLMMRAMVTRCPALGQPCQRGVLSPPPTLPGRRDTSLQDCQCMAKYTGPRGQDHAQMGEITACKPWHCFPASAPSSKPGRNVQPWPTAARRDFSGCVCAAPGTASTTGDIKKTSVHE